MSLLEEFKKTLHERAPFLIDTIQVLGLIADFGPSNKSLEDMLDLIEYEPGFVIAFSARSVYLQRIDGDIRVLAIVVNPTGEASRVWMGALPQMEGVVSRVVILVGERHR